MSTLKVNFFKYVSLNVLGMMGLSCYILADTFFVAQALGQTGLAALNFAISIFSVMQGVGLMIGIGGATDFSISGQKHAGSRTSFVHALILGGAASAVLVAAGQFFTVPLSRILGADAETLPLTSTYLAVVLTFSPAFILNNILLAFVRNDHNPKLSMAAMLVSSLSNIILDYVFMFPMGMGMFGAALATGLSPVISLLVLSLHFVKKRHSFHLGRCALSFAAIRRIAALGFSSFVGELASAISLIVFNLVILRLAGNTGVAAYGVVANIALIATAIFVGIAQGVQPLASKHFGRGDQMQVRALLRYALCAAAALSAILYLCIFLFTQPIVSAFNSETSASLARMAETGMKLYFIGYFFAGLNIVVAAFLSATARAGQAMLLATLRSCILLVPLVLVFGALLGMTGVWLSFVATEGAVLLCAAVFLRRFGRALA